MIDMKALAAIMTGDPDAKIAVKRRWLTEVHAQIVAGEKAKADLAALRAQRKLGDGLEGIADKLFGLNGRRT